MFTLEGKIALIAGGGTGISKAIAYCMTQAGTGVLIAGRHEKTLTMDIFCCSNEQ